MPRIHRRPATVTARERSARDISGGQRIGLELEVGDEAVPAVLLLPHAAAPTPAALLLHGYTSHKERMSESVGRALLALGVASIAIDLPLHGAREGRLDELSLRTPFELIRRWRGALAECRAALRYLAEQPSIDAERLALVGYSLGSFVGVQAAADEPLVRAVVLAAGGDLPERTPFASVVRTVADPLRAVRRLAGRPLLMVNGRLDRTVTAAQAERLFEAAGEPKEIRWYAGGHWPPSNEIEGAARWLAAALGSRRSALGRGV